MSPADGLLHAALDCALLSGRAALRHFGGGFVVERKGDGSPVTVADREAERAARDWIAERFPGDGVIGEEFGRTEGMTGRTWLLDPVDGTRTFVRGVPLWGSLVAIVEGETVLAGAASFPALGESIIAAPGQGCWHNAARCGVSGTNRLRDALVLTSDAHGFTAEHGPGWQRLASSAATVRTWGDCYGYLLVATGRAEVMADGRLGPWDIACFIPIIAEAGGVITDLEGRSGWRITNALASNAAVAVEARACF